MKIKALLLFVLCLGILGFGLRYAFVETRPDLENRDALVFARAKSAVALPSLSRPSDRPIPGADDVPRLASEKCRELFRELEPLDFTSGFQPDSEFLVTLGKCHSDDPLLARLLGQAQDCLQKKTSPADAPQGESACLQEIVFLRAAVENLKRRKSGRGPENVREIIEDLILAFMGADMQPDFNQAADLAKMLRDASNGNSKAIALSLSLDVIASVAGQPPRSINWAEARRDLDELKLLDPDDPQISSLDWLIEAKGMDDARMSEVAKGRLAKNPNDVDAHLVAGSRAWKAGDRTTALRHLESARRLKPEHPNVKAALAETSAPNADSSAFKLNFSIGLNPKDFL